MEAVMWCTDCSVGIS